MTHCVSTVLFVFATCVLVQLASTLPLRMRTHEVQKRDVSNSSIVCAVKKLQEAVSHVEIERMVPCETLSHANIQMLLRKLESLEKYAIMESIFDSLASPEHVNTLLEVMNSTLPVIAAIVSSEDEEDGFDSSVYIPDCSNYLCRDNCSTCIANCAVHRLKIGIMDLIQLLEDDYVPECEVCVEESLKTEAVQLADKLEAITDELLKPTAENLCPLYFPQFHTCDQVLVMQDRLEMISTWMNDSFTSLNGSHSFQNLELLVERLSVGVLPETRKSLEILKQDNCTDLQALPCTMMSPEQIALQVSNALSNRGCNLEPQLLILLRTLEFLKFNYSYFVRDLLPLVNILP